jgi:isocitrate/isopropylmalate dehydrogenase
MTNKTVVVFDGDDASPEVMQPTVTLLEGLGLPITFERPLLGLAAQEMTGEAFPAATRAAIDAADTTFFGSTSGNSTAALFYLRWGKQTYANVRPTEWLPGFVSPMKHPENIDFVTVRENLEDLYLGLEGDIADIAGLNLYSRHARQSLTELGPGKYAIKAITEKGAERVIRFAFELARKRNKKKRLTVTCKYNMLSIADGLFRDIAINMASDFPDVELNTYIIDDFLCRMISHPEELDVVVMPNLYGDIMSDGAAGMIGGLGLAPSGCYGDDYAYFESAHGTAPDIAGQHIINPTATLLSAAMMLDYLNFEAAANEIRSAIKQLYANGQVLTPDQGGTSKTYEFCSAVADLLTA